MKKIIAIAALLVSSVATFAQQSAKTFTIQPKIGINLADLSGIYGKDLRIGLAAGAELTYQASDKFGISIGALYSMQGSKDEKMTAKFDYINVPILANLYAAKGFAIKLGLQPGFNVNAAISDGFYSAIANSYKPCANTADLSAVFGMSYEHNNLVIDARFNAGLTKVAKDQDDKNRVIQITIGHKIQL